jgi:hypothetical protein
MDEVVAGLASDHAAIGGGTITRRKRERKEESATPAAGPLDEPPGGTAKANI